MNHHSSPTLGEAITLLISDYEPALTRRNGSCESVGVQMHASNHVSTA